MSPERAHPHASFDERLPQCGNRPSSTIEPPQSHPSFEHRQCSTASDTARDLGHTFSEPVACSSRGSLSNRSSDAFAAAQASGLAMKVGPCMKAARVSSGQKASKTSSLARVAANPSFHRSAPSTGKECRAPRPPVRRQTSVPVRPNPVKISSAISNIRCRRAAAAMLGQHPRRMKAHTARALDKRFNNQRRYMPGLR